jgi:hypothetical protein
MNTLANSIAMKEETDQESQKVILEYFPKHRQVHAGSFYSQLNVLFLFFIW